MGDGTVTEPVDAGSGRRWARVLLVVAVAVALGVVAWLVLRDGPTTVTGEDGQPVEVIASTDGFALTGSRVTAEIDAATGEPGAEKTTFATGETVRYWLSFDDSGAQPGKDTLFVVFTRDGADGEEQLFRAPFRLPQPIGQQNVSLGSGQTGETGEYRIAVLVNDEEIHTETFEVR